MVAADDPQRQNDAQNHGEIYEMFLRIFIQNVGDLSNFCCEIDIFVTRVNDFKFYVDLGLRILNFANLSISQNFKFSQILFKKFGNS